MLSQENAERLHVSVGDRLRVHLFGVCDERDTWQSPKVVKVVGLQLSPGEVRPPSGAYFQWLEVTPAFVRSTNTEPTPYLAVQLRSGATVSEFQKQASDAGFGSTVYVDRMANGRAVLDAVRPTQLSLAVLAAVVALVAAAVFGQLLVRQVSVESRDDDVLAALGMRARDRLVVSVLRGGFIAAVAVAAATTIAIALSPTMPIGIARRVEPHRGISIDVLVLGLIVVIGAAFVIGVSALATVRTGGRRRHRAPTRIFSEAAAWVCLPPR